MGRPRKWKNDAEKAKAYRDRKKAAERAAEKQTPGQKSLVDRVMASDAAARAAG